MRIGLIGLGDVSQKAYLPIIANTPGITPALCTRDQKTLALLGNKYRIDEQYTDIKSLIHSGLDAAMVHSSTSSHTFFVEQLLNARIPTFVDKPISYQFDETKKIIDLSTRNDTLLFVGFNRRYAPLIAQIKEPFPVHISLKKNRPYLPGDRRKFIFDDFIHVIDTLRFLSSREVDNFQTWSYQADDQLGALHVQWQSDDTLLTGCMNRVSGIGEESLEVFGRQQTLRVDNLASGRYNTTKSSKSLGFDDWQSTLYKRGFVDMLDHFIHLSKTKVSRPQQLGDILKTHELCNAAI